MEATTIAAAAAPPGVKAVNFLATSPTSTTTFSPKCPPQRPKMLGLCSPSFVIPRRTGGSNNHNLRFLPHCSTKPDTNTDYNNETDPNPTLEHNSSNSNSKTHLHDSSSSSSTKTENDPSSLRGLVFDLGPTNSWDGSEIGSPVVKRFLSDDEERWYMWYYGNSSGSPGSDSIGLAISSNGIHWERGQGPVTSAADVGLVMKTSQDWWAFDTSSIRPSEIVIMSSAKVRASSAVYWLYYTGYSNEKVGFMENDSLELDLENPERVSGNLGGNKNGKVFKSLPGLAISQDGRHWARIEGDHHSGALFDVGSDKEWDSLFIASPQVVFHGSNDLRMYYHSFDVENGEFCIGVARSRDGIKWVKLGKILGGGTRGGFDELGVKNPCVVRNKKEGKYLMAYEGVCVDGKGIGSSNLGLVESRDGLKEWRRIQDGGVLEIEADQGDDGWDSRGIGSPCLVQVDGDGEEQWRLYYRGVGDGGRSGIGMAVSEGSDYTRFRRWRGFHL